jgi:tRNA A37 threonylcarbamoyladenosine dehydratase
LNCQDPIVEIIKSIETDRLDVARAGNCSAGCDASTERARVDLGWAPLCRNEFRNGAEFGFSALRQGKIFAAAKPLRPDSPLAAGDVTVKPRSHVTMFAGEFPCGKHGQPLEKISAGGGQKISDDLIAEHTFSSKPSPDGYPDYYEKMTTYVAILSSQAEAIDPNATARTRRVIANYDPESVFNYIVTASSRAGIAAVTQRIAGQKIAIVGGGGTGSYTLDFVAKTPVAEIHVYDKDKFLQHNAFRTPGAASLADLKKIPGKAVYLHGIYPHMHRKIFPHDTFIDASNVDCLRGMDFVFLCLDQGRAKQVIVEKLEAFGIPFVDVGMGIELVDESLIGVLRVTTSTKPKREHVRSKNRIAFTGDGHENADSSIEMYSVRSVSESGIDLTNSCLRRLLLRPGQACWRQSLIG